MRWSTASGTRNEADSAGRGGLLLGTPSRWPDARVIAGVAGMVSHAPPNVASSRRPDARRAGGAA